MVHTQQDSEEVAEAQADNLEIMLVNHPLDCPICDQAGQCPLQIQAYKYGPEGSRFEFEKVHKPKRVQLGPNVVLDAERCINCTRCTRFTAEVTETHQLTIINRGDKNHPMTAPGEVFDDAYSMCTADICPVGALTEDYFRFKARVWEMSKTPSISDFGGKGINVDFWVRDNQVLRITPRENLDVNEYWMPDAARLVYTTYNENRASGAMAGRPPRRLGHGLSRRRRLAPGRRRQRLLPRLGLRRPSRTTTCSSGSPTPSAPRRRATSPAGRRAAATAGSSPTTPRPTPRACERLGFQAVDP